MSFVALRWTSSISCKVSRTGCQTEWPYLRIGLTSALYSWTKVWSVRWSKDLRITPRILFVLVVACEMWSLKFNWLSTTTPKSFSALLVFRGCLPLVEFLSAMKYVWSDAGLPNLSVQHFSGWKFSSQATDHWCSLSRSACKISLSRCSLLWVKSLVSSAKIRFFPRLYFAAFF